MSEEIKIVKETIEIKNDDNRDKKTEHSENQEKINNNLEKYDFKDNKENKESIENKENKEIKNHIQTEEYPYINIRKVSNLSDSVINYFAISISLFLYASYNLEWFHLHDEDNQGQFFVNAYFIFAGTSLYVIGILNWYEGKELLFLFDFIFSFLFIALFLKGQNLGDISSRETNDKLEGLFYILFFAFILIIGISSKGKGIIFSVNYAILFLAFVFLFSDKFFGNKWVKYIHSYAFIVAAGFLWVTGILKLINNGLVNKSIKILDPTD
jgi:hypothetical protein